MFLDWNEESPVSSLLESDIDENEIGSQNFERYKQLSEEDQKRARKKYREKLLQNSGHSSTDESSAERNGRVLFPDGMQNVKVSKF